MEFTVWITYLAAVMEALFFTLTCFYLIKGIKTKDYTKFKWCGTIYIILNFFRHVVNFVKKGIAVSIIGGADGPTSVFVAGRVGSHFMLLEVLVIAAVAAGIGFLIYKGKKKR